MMKAASKNFMKYVGANCTVQSRAMRLNPGGLGHLVIHFWESFLTIRNLFSKFIVNYGIKSRSNH
jgi:hypothetical protein